MLATFSAHDRAQKPVRVNREELPYDFKEGCEPAVSPTLLWGTPSLIFKDVGDASCVVVSAQAPSSCVVLYPFDVIWTGILNAWVGGGGGGVPNTKAVLNLGAD